MKTAQKRLSRPLVALGSCLIAAFLMVGLPPLHGQESVAPPSKVERKNKAPVSRDILRVKLPRPIEARLKNGLTVLILEDKRAPYVTLQLYIGGAGALFEPNNMPGLAHAAAAILSEGTQSRTSVQIAEDIDRLGASLSAGSSFGRNFRARSTWSSAG